MSPQERQFNEILREFTKRQNMSTGELIDNFGVSKSTWFRWISRSSNIPRRVILQLIPFLNLNVDEGNILLNSAGHSPISPEDSSEIIKFAIDKKFPGDIIHDLRLQLAKTENSIDAISSNIEEIKPTDTKDGLTDLREEIQKLQENFSQLQNTSQKITAPVILPTQEEMEVRLVSSTSLERLEEYRSEESKWFSWTGIFIGAVIGVFVNWATGGQVNPTSWILVATFVLIAILTALSAREFRRRGDRLKEGLIGKSKPKKIGEKGW